MSPNTYTNATNKIHKPSLLLAIASTLGASTQGACSDLPYNMTDIKTLIEHIREARELLAPCLKGSLAASSLDANLSYYQTFLAEKMSILNTSDTQSISLGTKFYELEKVILSLQWVNTDDTLLVDDDRLNLSRYMAVHDSLKVQSSAMLAIELYEYSGQDDLTEDAQRLRSWLEQNPVITSKIHAIKQYKDEGSEKNIHECLEAISKEINTHHDHDYLQKTIVELMKNASDTLRDHFPFLSFLYNRGLQCWSGEDFNVFKVTQLQYSAYQIGALNDIFRQMSADEKRKTLKFACADFSGQKLLAWNKYAVPTWFPGHIQSNLEALSAESFIEKKITDLLDVGEIGSLSDSEKWFVVRFITVLRLDQNSHFKTNSDVRSNIVKHLKSLSAMPSISVVFGFESQIEFDYLPELFLQIISTHLYTKNSANSAKVQEKGIYISYLLKALKPMLELTSVYIDSNPPDNNLFNCNQLKKEILAEIRSNCMEDFMSVLPIFLFAAALSFTLVKSLTETESRSALLGSLMGATCLTFSSLYIGHQKDSPNSEIKKIEKIKSTIVDMIDAYEKGNALGLS